MNNETFQDVQADVTDLISKELPSARRSIVDKAIGETLAKMVESGARPWTNGSATRQGRNASMAERALIFQAESILGLKRFRNGEPGGKIQSRRIIKPQPPARAYRHYDASGAHWVSDYNDSSVRRRIKGPESRIQVGDIVRVKEAMIYDGLWRYRVDGDPPVIYDSSETAALTWAQQAMNRSPWTPPMFMPRWASRFWLRITRVGCERVQDITEDDAMAEGYLPEPLGTICDDDPPECKALAAALGPGMWSAKFGFMCAFQDINGERAWHDNPLVWVYEWDQCCERPEDIRQ